jgi:hypothetical protein
MALTKIISDGQTGVDRAALDAAIALGFPCGGSCTTDLRAAERARQNVTSSDGTAILFTGSFKGGTKLTRDLCIRHKKAFVVLDAAQISAERAVAAILRFIAENEISILNVVGPREHLWDEGHAFALAVIEGVILSSGQLTVKGLDEN